MTFEIILERSEKSFYRMTDDTRPVLLVFCVFTDFQLDQLVIDSAMEKREMEHKHATIQQRVSARSKNEINS